MEGRGGASRKSAAIYEGIKNAHTRPDVLGPEKISSVVWELVPKHFL